MPDSSPLSSSWTPVPILMYHAVEDAPRPPHYKHFYVLAHEFAVQMRQLKRAGYAPITFDQLARARAGTEDLPPNPVLLTFDDGYENLLAHVHPLLHELGFPYTVFLVSAKIGGTNDWVAADGYEPTALLSWAQIHAMQADGGVQFEAHTATHPKLASLPPNEVRRELVTCRETLEQRLQYAIRTLCYPYGNYDQGVVQAARDAGYTQAVTTDFGRVHAEDNPLTLPRISVYHVPPFSLTYGIGVLNFLWRLRTRKDTRTR